MTKTKEQVVKAKGTRTARSPEYKAAALARAERIGVGAAARELGINESQLYGWKQRVQADRQCDSVERVQAAEITRLKRVSVVTQKSPVVVIDVSPPITAEEQEMDMEKRLIEQSDGGKPKIFVHPKCQG